MKLSFFLDKAMDQFSCIIIRHRKENLKKCSLSGLEGRSDLKFFRYPDCLVDETLPSLKGYVLLDMEGELLSEKDTAPLVLLDASWRYAAKMRQQIKTLSDCVCRRLPDGWMTAYPRYQTDCIDPWRGLASIEALYAAYCITGRSPEGLLDLYYWKELFLQTNGLEGRVRNTGAMGCVSTVRN
jgi:pre-rRNA-processing protein TSR3